MPTDLRFAPKQRRLQQRLDLFLVVATRCLIGAAVALATVIFIELEIASWQVAGIDPGIPPDLEMTTTSP